MDYILDTNIVLTYLRNNIQARNLEQTLNLLSGQHNLIISVVSIGELKSIAKQNNWGKRRINNLEDMLSDFLIADINTEAVIEKYATIDAFSQGKLVGKKVNFSARNMGKNDLWIAATAAVLDIPLFTTDKDFAHLQGKFLQLRQIDLGLYK